MRKYFSTTYPVKSKSNPEGIRFSGYILADSLKDAIGIAVKRNLEEEIDSIEGSPIQLKIPVTRPSTIFLRMNRATRVTDRHRDVKKLMHLCCFLLHLTERKGLTLPDNFSDVGLMHQLVHALMIPKAELSIEFYDLLPVLKELESHHPEMFLSATEIQTLTT